MSASDAWLLAGHTASVPSSDRCNCPLDQGGSAVEAEKLDEDEAESEPSEADFTDDTGAEEMEVEREEVADVPRPDAADGDEEM